MRILDAARQSALNAALGQLAPETAGLSRRDFLRLGAGAGLIVAIPLAGSGAALAAETEATATAPAPFAPDAFLRIAPDNTVTVIVKHHEMGQGATTGVATLVAEELDADWSLVRAEYAPSNPQLYANTLMGIQGTGGSTSVANCWEPMRKAGATARALLVQAAAERWKVPASEIRTAKSVLSHRSGKRATYGEMAEAAARLTPPAKVKLKDPSQFTLIGRKDTRRLDSLAKCNGSAQYTIDVKLPGLLTAVVAHPPAFGATVKGFDATAAKAVPGVTDVVQIPEGVAVVATGMWPALQGRKALQVDWDLKTAETRSSPQLFAEYRELVRQPGQPARRAAAATPAAPVARSIEAVYEFPYLAHATMEPMNCVAWLHDGQLETWSGHQVQTLDHANAAAAAGLPLDKVQLHTLISGGSFGRRATPPSDYVVEAVHIAKAINGRAPVKLQRTREDDLRAGHYRALFLHAVKIDLDAKGQLLAWDHRIAGQSIAVGTPLEAMTVKDGIDHSSVEGSADTPYTLPNHGVSLHTTQVGVPVLWWRSVGHTHNAFVMETLIDELAAAGGQDPVQLRLALLKDKPRHAAVLRLAAQKAGWGQPLPKGLARGIALHESFASYIAQVAEVRLVDGKPKVERVVVAVDCGTPVNPDQIRAQMEGGVGFALAAALYGAVDLDHGAPLQSNFHDYPVLRMHEMPKVEVHIVPSTVAPTGVGEPGVPPLAPAVANALYHLTGQRVRRLPLLRQDARRT